MHFYLDREGSVDGFEKLLDKAVKETGAGSLLFFTCDANGFEAGQTDPILRRVSASVFGGVFPAIIHENEKPR